MQKAELQLAEGGRTDHVTVDEAGCSSTTRSSGYPAIDPGNSDLLPLSYENTTTDRTLPRGTLTDDRVADSVFSSILRRSSVLHSIDTDSDSRP